MDSATYIIQNSDKSISDSFHAKQNYEKCSWWGRVCVSRNANSWSNKTDLL